MEPRATPNLYFRCQDMLGLACPPHLMQENNITLISSFNPPSMALCHLSLVLASQRSKLPVKVLSMPITHHKISSLFGSAPTSRWSASRRGEIVIALPL